MRTALLLALITPVAFADEPKRIDAPKPPDGFPRFKVQEIDAGLKIGYAVITADIDGDTKPDIVVVDQHKVVWYQNPTWQKRTMLDGKTKPDNVCVTAVDIDGDKLPEVVVGAGWKPADTKTPGTLQWLKRGKTLDDEWTMHPIPCDEPTVHRVKVADLDGDGKLEIIMAPLQGRDATAKGNWTDGRPVRILAYKVPTKEPEKADNWKPEVVSTGATAYEFNDYHVVHNFWVGVKPLAQSGPAVLLTASSDGVSLVTPKKSGGWMTLPLTSKKAVSEGGGVAASEVAPGRVSGEEVPVVATIEPWHGNQVVVYHEAKQLKIGQYRTRHVIDEQLRWGHAVSFADLNADGNELLIVGVRDNPTKDDKFTEKRGVRIYRHDPKAKKWERYILEDGGVAVEDLTVADLNADGKPDIVAVGRATGNARIYWNQGR